MYASLVAVSRLTNIKRLASAHDLFKDIGGLWGPNEWLGVVLVPVDILANGEDQRVLPAKLRDLA